MSKNEAYKNRIDDLFSDEEPLHAEPVEGQQPSEVDAPPSKDSVTCLAPE